MTSEESEFRPDLLQLLHGHTVIQISAEHPAVCCQGLGPAMGHDSLLSDVGPAPWALPH